MSNALDSAIHVVAIAQAKPGSEQQVKQILLGIVSKVRKEPGCLGYQLHQNREDAQQFVFVEAWQDASALSVHGQTRYFQQMLEDVEPYLAQPLTVHQLERIEP
ncbi:putative quinol monooxygenase [Celerinatantimonas sp. YJH-8]|uniref:putative quinol monooxygenase n=1 Tax=Celerinatantimonas sp. YJH-8 TaxID=3228714 RepID=UPI0038C258DE